MIAFAPFLMVIGIVWVKGQQQIEEKRIAASAGTPNVAGESVAVERIEELEERVRVLERIVTDRSYDVASQIEALRDQRPLEARLETAALREKI
jgi:hypothetical protein